MMKKNITVDVEIKALKAMALFVASEETRYNLSTVYCEIMPKETRLVATNGCCMAIYRVAPEVADQPEESSMGSVSVLLPKDVIKMIDGKSRASITVDDHGQADISYLSKSGHMVTLHGVQAGGRFPEYRAVLPRQCNREMSLYDPKFLRLFVKAAKMLNSSEKSDSFFDHCTLYPGGNSESDGPGIIEMRYDNNFTGIVMSMRPMPKEYEPNMFWIAEDTNPLPQQ